MFSNLSAQFLALNFSEFLNFPPKTNDRASIIRHVRAQRTQPAELHLMNFVAQLTLIKVATAANHEPEHAPS